MVFHPGHLLQVTLVLSLPHKSQKHPRLGFGVDRQLSPAPWYGTAAGGKSWEALPARTVWGSCEGLCRAVPGCAAAPRVSGVLWQRGGSIRSFRSLLA